MKLIKKVNKKGFTLIELVVVIAILAVLALILIPSITGYVKKADDAKNLANARSIYTAATVLYAESPDDMPSPEQVRLFADIEDNVYFTVTKEPDNLVVKIYKNATDIAATSTADPIATYPKP